MTSPPPNSTLLTDHLDLVEAAISSSCRRLSPQAREEVRAEVLLQLAEEGDAVLRSFEGRSRLETYLTVVVKRRVLDWQRKQWGKWRHSPAAKRLGEEAMELESLLYREWLTFDEAAGILASRRGREIDLDHLEHLASAIPRRERRLLEGEESLEHFAAGDPGPEANLLAKEEALERREQSLAVRRALDALSAEDRLIYRLRFEEGVKVVEIAHTLGFEAKPLYRRLERLWSTVAARAKEILGTSRAPESEKRPLRPSALVEGDEPRKLRGPKGRGPDHDAPPQGGKGQRE